MPSERTRLRGVIHRVAAPLFLAAFAVLIVIARSTADRIAVAVYGFGVSAMLCVSAVYHSGRLTERGERRLRRVDHSAILLAIAGTYTAVTGLALHGRTRVWLLWGIWVVAVIAILIRVAWMEAPRVVTAVVFLAVGWFMAVDMPAYVHALSGGQLALIACGGGAYTIGGVVYATKRPDPWPRTFGFHEVFHALVTLGALLHYLGVLALVRAS